MDKKSLGIVIALGVILVGIIVGVFVYEAKLNTDILEINNVKYDKADFESYLKVWQYENGETPVVLKEMFANYEIYKLYSQYVDLYHVELTEENKIADLTEEEKATLEANYALTESEYIRVKTEIALVDQLYANLEDYWKVSDADYAEHINGNEDLFKMYDYRVMQVAVEQPEATSGDEVTSGDTSGDVQARKNAAKSKAVEALAKVKSGDNFEEVAKEYGTNRIAYTSGGYAIVNGTLETVSGLYMNQYVWDANIIKALGTLEKGEYSEIYEDESSYTFVYLEDVRDGLDEADDAMYRKEIANSHIQGEAIIIENKITLKSINLEKLIPALAKVKDVASGDEAHDHEHDHSGESIEENNNGDVLTSGENE